MRQADFATKTELNLVIEALIPVVNGASYSSDDGYAYQMMGVMEENIGQIATIWVGYYDNYGTQWLDSIKVIINE